MGAPTESYYAVQVVSCTHHGWPPGAWVRRVHDSETGRDSNEVCRFPELLTEMDAKGYLRDLNDRYSSHSANTSDDAQAMWKSLNPRLAWDSEDPDASKFGGSKRNNSYYYLSRDML